MSFVPPRCPNPDCHFHREPVPGFCTRRGYYRPRCRDKPVQRYRCRGCGKKFSVQTFRHDYRDRRPDCNVPLFLLLTSGCGLRQAGRVLRLGVHAVQRKARKIARTCGALHDNLSPALPADRTWVLDEEETYEGASIRPLTMPVLIDKETWFVVATDVGSIRRLAKRGTKRRRLQDGQERVHGRRPDLSARCVRNVLQRLLQRLPRDGRLVLRSDEKSSYARIAKALFGERVEHETTSSTRVRGTFNPLFPINTTLAMTRDNCGRLHRRSWLVSKQGWCLQLHLLVFTVYRNYVRRRFNHDAPHETPAVHLKLLPRQLHASEVLAWRQDWGPRSIHPLSFCATSTVAHEFRVSA